MEQSIEINSAIVTGVIFDTGNVDYREIRGNLPIGITYQTKNFCNPGMLLCVIFNTVNVNYREIRGDLLVNINLPTRTKNLILPV